MFLVPVISIDFENGSCSKHDHHLVHTLLKRLFSSLFVNDIKNHLAWQTTFHINGRSVNTCTDTSLTRVLLIKNLYYNFLFFTSNK